MKHQSVDLPLSEEINRFYFMILTINGQQAALKKGSSIEYVSENRIFTDADDYSMENLRENEVFRHDFCYLCNQNNMKVE